MRRALRAGALSLTLAISACTITIGGPGDAPAEPSPTLPGGPSPSPKYEVNMDALVEDLDGDVAIAVVNRDGVHTAGITGEGLPAWSTIKVPIAIAAQRKGVAEDETVSAALEQSDNDAAEALWNALGTPAEAAVAVENVLEEADGQPDEVQTQDTRPGFSSYGQTAWTVEAQAHFAQALPGLADAEKVNDYLKHIDPNQSWGLGHLEGAAFKGGWGPDDEDGMYLARQFGYIDRGCGPVGIALAARAEDGTFESSTDLLDTIVRRLKEERSGAFHLLECSLS